MKAGTIVQLSDGRIGTVVYHGLDGYGIKWDRGSLDQYEIDQLNSSQAGDEFMPDAMLRDDYPSATVPCVGEEYEIIDPLPTKNVNNILPSKERE